VHVQLAIYNNAEKKLFFMLNLA